MPPLPLLHKSGLGCRDFYKERIINKTLILAFVPTLALLSCGGDDASASGSTLKGDVKIDGSSTVYPITEAVAEEFQKLHGDVRVTVGISGTGGGFKMFTLGETDISNASRPIKDKEIAAAAEHGVEFLELPVAYDGIAIVVNKANTFLQHITVEQLRRIWHPDSTVKSWSDVDPSWPAKPIKLYGPGSDSGTFDYFTETINGKEKACRADYSASEDDNFLVQGVVGDPDSLGFFGIAYYAENKERLKLIPVDGGNGPIAPTEETINDGSYKPLSRPLFIYVRPDALQKNPVVAAFVDFYLENAPNLVPEVGYVALPTEIQALTKKRLKSLRTGTMFDTGDKMSLLERMRNKTD